MTKKYGSTSMGRKLTAKTTNSNISTLFIPKSHLIILALYS